MTSTATYTVLSEEDFTTIPESVEHSRKVLSSVILSEEILEEPPQVRYVEVPIVEEVVRKVATKKIVEVEKIVPRYEVEYVEKHVEIPEIHYVDRHVEKEHIQEVIKEVPGELEVREIPRTVIKKQPIIRNITVEKVVEVPGPIVNVTQEPIEMEPIKQYHDVEVPVVVAQTIRPIITQYEDYVDVDIVQYEPEITPVDVYVATPIASKLVTIGTEKDVHNCVSIPPAQYNTILKSLNQHIPDDQLDQIPFIKMNGEVTFLSKDEAPGYIALDSAILSKGPQDKDLEEIKEVATPSASDSFYNTANFHHEEFNAPEMDSSFMAKKSNYGFEKKKKLCGC